MNQNKLRYHILPHLPPVIDFSCVDRFATPTEARTGEIGLLLGSEFRYLRVRPRLTVAIETVFLSLV